MEGEIDLLDQENALLELEDIVDRVRTMAAVSYDLDIEEVWEFLDIWAAGVNAEATKLLAALKAAVVGAGPALICRVGPQLDHRRQGLPNGQAKHLDRKRE